MFRPDRPGLPFVNADRIAVARFPGEELARSREVAKIAAATRRALLEARLDFCAETEFSHPAKVDLVTAAVEAGYDVVLHAVLIPSSCPGRGWRHVSRRDPDVPESKLADRYQRLSPLVAAAVAPSHRTVFWNNAGDHGPVEVASYQPRWPVRTPAVLHDG